MDETYDFLFEPTAPGEMRLQVLRPATRSLVVAQVLIEECEEELSCDNSAPGTPVVVGFSLALTCLRAGRRMAR